MKIRFTIFEIIIGAIAMITGLVLTLLVWDEGYFVGALMLVVTGSLSVLLAIKEIKNPGDKIQTLNVFFSILRRTFLFLNLMLSSLVIGMLTRLISF